MSKYEDLVPLTRPPFPNPATTTPEEMEAFVSQWEHVNKVNNRRVKKAMHRIKLCAWLKGFRKGLVPSLMGMPALDQEHYAWCPYDEWTKPITKVEYHS